MKPILVLIISFAFSANLIAQKGFTDKLEAENKYKDSLKEGKWVEYYTGNNEIVDASNAVYYRLTIFRAGQPNGMVREYFDPRHIKSEIQYVDGKKSGTEKEYYSSGVLWRKIPYKNDKINGMVISYYENGNREFEIPYRNGKKDGTEKDYYISRELNWEKPYVNDTLNGIVKEYHAGILYKETSFKKGKIDGVVKTYYQDGKLWFVVLFTKGDANGAAKYYYENGKLKSEIPYTDDKINGVDKEYFPDGKLESETTYNNGQKGTSKIYNEDGEQIN